MRILLVSPSSDDDINIRVIRAIPYLLSDAFFAPHACAVIAALTPAGHEVRIHDEHLHGPVDHLLEREAFDVVGISLITNQVNRSLAIAERFRELGRPGALVIGGVGTSHMLPRIYELVDAVFVGEAEETWPQYLHELAAGRPASLYRTVARPDMAQVPPPRWEIIRQDIPRYSAASVQTSRGCVHDCSFCDVIYTFGRRLRLKPPEQVVEEVRTLEGMGAKMIYFADDNFAADRGYAKELLRRMVESNRAFSSQIAFMTQVDITVAQDDELLQLMLDANMMEVQIGIESVSADALQEMNKTQNLDLDPVWAVRKIQSFGIIVLAHMIVGADADGPDAFARTESFLNEASVVHHICHPLMAPPGTRLWYQLKRQGRIIDAPPEIRDRMDVTTNIVPRQMTRVQLMEGLADHWERVVRPQHFLERALGFIRGIRHRPSFKVTNQPSPWSMRRMLLKMLWHYLFRVPADHRRVFFRVLREAFRQIRDLMPRAIFAHTFYTMELHQARIAAGWARALAERERALAGGIGTLPPAVPIPERIRERAREILSFAYRQVRPRVKRRSALYQAVLESVTEFIGRFGPSFERLDETEREALGESCDRAVALLPAPGSDGSAEQNPGAALPLDRPPPGFVREMVDAIDREIRLQENPKAPRSDPDCRENSSPS